MRRSIPLCLVALSVSLSACAVDRASRAEPAVERARAAERVVAPVLSPAEVLGALAILNGGEAQAAELAVRASRDEQVRELARRILRDHGEMQADAFELARDLQIGLEESAVSERVRARMAGNLETLQAAADEPDFDRRYLRAQIASHEAALALFDDALLPAADDVQLEQFLMSARPALVEHLEEARALAASVVAAR